MDRARLKSQDDKKKKKLDPRGKAAIENGKKTRFGKGNQLATGNSGYLDRMEKRFISKGMYNFMFEEMEVAEKNLDGTTKKDKNDKALKRRITRGRYFIEQMFKEAVNGNGQIAKMVQEMLEGKNPQEINVNAKIATLSANMTVKDAAQIFRSTLHDPYDETMEQFLKKEKE